MLDLLNLNFSNRVKKKEKAEVKTLVIALKRAIDRLKAHR